MQNPLGLGGRRLVGSVSHGLDLLRRFGSAPTACIRRRGTGIKLPARLLRLGGGFLNALRRWSDLRKGSGAEGNRTPDLFHAMEALYQLSYSPSEGETLPAGASEAVVARR